MTEESTSHSPESADPVWPVFLLFGAVLFGLLLGSVVVALVFIVLAQGQPGDSPFVEDGNLSPEVLLGGFAVTVPAMLIGTFLFLRRRGVSWTERLRWRPVSPASIVLASVGGLCVSQLVAELLALSGALKDSTIYQISLALQTAPADLYIVLVAAVLLTAVVEELFFRGQIQGRLAARWGSWPAIVVAALMFGVFHLDPLHSTFAFVFGLYLGWTVERTQSLLPAVAAHVLNNLVSVIASRFVPVSPEETTVGGLGSAFCLVVASLCILGVARLNPR